MKKEERYAPKEITLSKDLGSRFENCYQGPDLMFIFEIKVCTRLSEKGHCSGTLRKIHGGKQGEVRIGLYICSGYLGYLAITSSVSSLMSTSEIKVSLETHLLHGLNRISPILPNHLATDLAQYIVNPPPLAIPYKTLLAISQWTRTADGQDALQAHSIRSHDYSMISLLAGTTSSPEGKFGTYIPPKEPEQIEAERINERKSITALINALLSIGGVAFATWWAADKTGWRNEWVRITTTS